ncbi:MAG: hypothetical protein IJ959_02570 [Clostridia bacterium]|nr:hypothetical protein [Clostridia bacterium]
MKSKKIGVRESWYIFSIVMLSVLLMLSLYLFLQNPFVTNQPDRPGLPPVGTPLNISVDAAGSNAQSVFFHGSVLPQTFVPQEVKIILKPNQENAVARAKAVMFNEFGKQIPLALTTSSNWAAGNDGYYYCQEVLSANLMVDFVKELQMPAEKEGLNSANVYSIIFSIETLPQNANFEEIWKIN